MDQVLILDHINEIGWVDDTAPQEEFLCSDIDILVERMLKAREEHTEIPIIVHCSAGIGRTGTVIAIFNIVESLIYARKYQNELVQLNHENRYLAEKYPEILENPMRVSIFSTVRKLRE
jgi:protein tyrosine phosphatase